MIRSVLVMVTSSCLLLFSFSRPANSAVNSASRKLASVFGRGLHMWESGDLSRFEEIVATNYLGHVASRTRNREGLRARIQAFHKLYPDIHFTIEDQFGQGDKLVTRMRAVGTNSASGRRRN